VPALKQALKKMLRDVAAFSCHASGVTLRKYQVEAARAIALSAIRGEGKSFVVMFPRQSGKNEMQAQIEAYLLTLLSRSGAEIVKISPTWKPQAQNAMRRLERVLKRNLLTRAAWTKESGYIYRVGNARITFLSGSPGSNIVGATASTLLEIDEAQDVNIAKYDKEIAPMAASANATRVFWGTAWTSQTLLARELRAARQAEKDGGRRAFVLDAADVAAEVPAYGQFVAAQVARLGSNHPMVMTQFFSLEIDGEGGMFPPDRRLLMQGEHLRQFAPQPGKVYAMLVDVGGEEMNGQSPERHDATALTIVEVDTDGLKDDLLRAPRYRVVNRRLWTGAKHSALYGEIAALAESWGARRVVIDATGVGAGLASFLEKRLPGKVIPFIFNTASKSRLGWNFLSICDTGRFKDWGDEAGPRSDALQKTFQRQLELCQYETPAGAGQTLKWGVPDGTRDPETGEAVHDDLLLSAALCAVLDEQTWTAGGEALLLPAADPLIEIDRGGY